MKKMLSLFVASMMAVALSAESGIPDALPQRAVRGANNIAYASYSYGCPGVFGDDISFSVNLEKPSRGITVVVVQVSTEYNGSYKKTVVFRNGQQDAYVTFTIGSGNCGDIKIVDAYVKR